MDKQSEAATAGPALAGIAEGEGTVQQGAVEASEEPSSSSVSSDVTSFNDVFMRSRPRHERATTFPRAASSEI